MIVFKFLLQPLKQATFDVTIRSITIWEQYRKEAIDQYTKEIGKEIKRDNYLIDVAFQLEGENYMAKNLEKKLLTYVQKIKQRDNT